jgi:membrane-associated phospholipid phosphatase
VSKVFPQLKAKVL